ncbi:MAG TPA: hypothetical protein VFZ65_08595 [Planctomycetota bacterium]|nr:hypothetical protein [Planctomycetota bacterium]
MTRSLATLCLLLTCLPAQEEPPTVGELAQTAHQLVEQLSASAPTDGAGDEQKAARAAATKALEELVVRMETLTGLSVEHYVEVSSPMIFGCPQQCVRVAVAGLQHFPDSRFLWDHVGFARTQIAIEQPPCQARLAELQEAARAFRKALSNQPDTFHAHVGMFQVASLLGQVDDALVEFEAATKDEEGRQALPDAWLLRAGLLLRLGRAEDAAKLLGSDVVTDELRGAAQILLLRAHAIGGDAAAAQALIKKMRAADAGPRVLVEAADALAYLGKKTEALQLLAQRPKRGAFETEEERVDQLLTQGAAAMEVFWKASDWSPKGPLRTALTAALEHRFLVMDTTAKPKPKETDLTASPALLAQLLGNAPESDEKAWADRTLLVLAIRSIRDHKSTPLEKQMLALQKDQRMPTSADEPAIFLAMRWDVGNPDACGVLTGLRAIEKLDAPVAGRK